MEIHSSKTQPNRRHVELGGTISTLLQVIDQRCQHRHNTHVISFDTTRVHGGGLFSCLLSSHEGGCYLFTCNTAGRDCDYGNINYVRVVCEGVWLDQHSDIITSSIWSLIQTNKGADCQGLIYPSHCPQNKQWELFFFFFKWIITHILRLLLQIKVIIRWTERGESCGSKMSPDWSPNLFILSQRCKTSMRSAERCQLFVSKYKLKQLLLPEQCMEW